MPDKDNFVCVIVLNDQGGSVMNWNDEGMVDTLRAQTHGHEPIVVVGGGAENRRMPNGKRIL